MRNSLVFPLLSIILLLAGCNINTENSKETSGSATDSENLPSEEELEEWSQLLLTLEEQIKLKQEITDFYGSEEAFMEHGFAYIDKEQKNKGVIAVKETDSKETEKLKKQIYQTFTKEQVEFIQAIYSQAELSRLQDEILHYLKEIGAGNDIGDETEGDYHMTSHPNLREQKIKLEISPITDEQLQLLKEKYGDVLIVDATYGGHSHNETENEG